MKYIDKSINQTAANAIVDELLDDSWDGTIYIGANYDGLKKPIYKERFTNLLLDEQHNLCCYCMQEIEPAVTTLEHIIPQEVKKADFARYLVVAELKNYVNHKADFNTSVRVIPPIKYPHDIAYFNLIASCNRNHTCNHFRGNKFIFPLFYDKNIQDEVEYDEDGIAYSGKYFDELDKIGISTSDELKMYRKIWKELSLQFDSAEKITNEDIEMIILTLVGNNKYQTLLNNFYGNPSKKDDLMKYRWFFDYYKNA